MPEEDWRVDAGGGGWRGRLGSQEGYPSEPSDALFREDEEGRSDTSPGWSTGESPADEVGVGWRSAKLGCFDITDFWNHAGCSVSRDKKTDR
jgi:hypothetical protein